METLQTLRIVLRGSSWTSPWPERVMAQPAPGSPTTSYDAAVEQPITSGDGAEEQSEALSMPIASLKELGTVDLIEHSPFSSNTEVTRTCTPVGSSADVSFQNAFDCTPWTNPRTASLTSQCVRGAPKVAQDCLTRFNWRAVCRCSLSVRARWHRRAFRPLSRGRQRLLGYQRL